MKIETSRCLGCGAAVVDGAPYFKALLGAAGNAPAAVAKLVTKKIARK